MTGENHDELDAERLAAQVGALGQLGRVEDTIFWFGRMKNGDQDAINRLFARYHDRLARIVRLRMSDWLRRQTDPEEIVNSTFLTAWKNISRFEMRDHSSFLLWLDKIAQRKITDAADFWKAQMRDAGRNVSIDADGRDASSGTRQLPDRGHSPSSLHIQQETKRIYDDCVAALPEEARELVLLREYAGSSSEEVAQLLGKPTAHAVEEAYRRARVKLAAALRKRLGPN